jgi:cell cycle arrest protein BUB3
VITGSWDQTAKLWDLRSPNACVGSYEQPGRVFTMALSDHRLIVGTSGRNIWIWDLRKMGEAEQRRESRHGNSFFLFFFLRLTFFFLSFFLLLIV